jgi:hypothetical protein
MNVYQNVGAPVFEGKLASVATETRQFDPQ